MDVEASDMKPCLVCNGRKIFHPPSYGIREAGMDKLTPCYHCRGADGKPTGLEPQETP